VCACVLDTTARNARVDGGLGACRVVRYTYLLCVPGKCGCLSLR